jgi:restriction-modification enzyme MmeI-like protein
VRHRHPVTGELVPDPEIKIPYMEYVKPRPASWPKADFIVGNPPYIGNKRMRMTLGDGYVEALRKAYKAVPGSADFVMYWWYRAAKEILAGHTSAAGLITTNSITQRFNRAVVADAREHGAFVRWAVADHPWVDEVDGAAVRVAMTVVSKRGSAARLIEVDEGGQVESVRTVSRLNDDLSASINVIGAAEEPLLANQGISFRGVIPVGPGFILDGVEARDLIAKDAANAQVVRPYVNGKDLAARPRGVSIIDFGAMSEEEARRFALPFDIVRDRVKPDRDANREERARLRWWRFGRDRGELREAIMELDKYIATAYTARHRVFSFLPSTVVPDDKVVCLATDDAYILGVVSSRIHLVWASAAGGNLGVGNDEVYNNPLCFDAFPLPEVPRELRAAIAAKADGLDSHRSAAMARDEAVTVTGMYNIVEKLRSGESLTSEERQIHVQAACGVLRDLHDELDALVAQAYGWSWPMEKELVLERLVALHDERVTEEKTGNIRWLRREYQIPRFGKTIPKGKELLLEVAGSNEAALVDVPWPRTAIEQLTSVKA